MKLILSSILTVISLTTITAHAAPNTTKPAPKKDSVEYFVANPKLALETVNNCDLQIATLADHEKVYGANGTCRNAMLARKQIIKKRNSPSNPMPKFDFSKLNNK